MAKAGPDGEPRSHLLLYAVAAASYVGVGIFEKGILNWVMGPLWLLAVLALGLRLAVRRRERGSP